jgi:hypothetical protein
MGMMISLQRRIQRGVDEDWERRFFAHTLQYLTTSSGRQVEVEDWMITSYEVEFGHEIGSGGLYVFFIGFQSVLFECVILPVDRCSKGVGTGPMWHSRYSPCKMVLLPVLRCVENRLINFLDFFDIHFALHSLSVMRSK